MRLAISTKRLLRRMFPTRSAALSQSRLVGMYLTQTNRTNGFASDFQQSRERRNGKFSHNRERA